MIISIKIAMYFFSLLILTISLLFFVTLGGVFCSYLYKKIGDSSSWDSGYNSFNPSKHVDFFLIILFILTGWFVGIKKPPFINNWENGIKGFIQKISYLLIPTIFYLIISAILLFIGVYFFSFKLLVLAFKTSLKANFSYIAEVSSLLTIKGPKLIGAVFLLYSVILNLNLSLLYLLFSFLDYIIKKFFLKYTFDIKFIFLLYGFVILLLYLFGNSIMYFFWNIIITPLILFL